MGNLNAARHQQNGPCFGHLFRGAPVQLLSAYGEAPPAVIMTVMHFCDSVQSNRDIIHL
jgi:hypothetical protein